MPKVFVSACGTSLLTNGADNSLRSLLISTSNEKETQLASEDKATIDKHLQTRTQLLQNASLSEIKRLSAELNGIVTYYEDSLPSSGEDLHYILGTDTYQGEAVADMVVTWLRDRGLNAQSHTIQDLATKNLDCFRAAMSDLIEWCDRSLGGYQAQDYYQVIFNLTGGFKSVNGFLQAAGMFYADECIYIFQGSSQLLRIPRLPITLDTDGIIAKHLTTFRQLQQQDQVALSDCQGIPETLLFQDKDFAGLSEWGKLIWKQGKPKYYERELLPPLSSQLIYSSKFKQSVKGIQPDRLHILNERLDDLSQYLDSHGNDNPPKLDFKKLKGKPFADSTHECDVWGDRGDRIYGHYLPDGRYQCDRLDKHL
ncbi:hypothetical protein [Roseofilum casamattae]|uniref:CRISPR system ring nuclease SSO1393-like domain-containing protein n=1 Tax=Roseofilum casamattae BLCC-M143 TaxID=3022442 RepID=A0ABT7BVU3_9CYAN|nr:hypothetical protein [Roseofilum casamattae]MDJ1183317.1 hypothetical protein [Roseofilum casamattae BLCC-M143]